MTALASIRGRLALILLGIVGGVVLFGSAIFLLHDRQSVRLTYAMLYETLAASARSVERELAGIERLGVDIMADSGIQGAVIGLGEIPDGYRWYHEAQSLSARLLSFCRLPDVPAIACVDSVGRAVNSRNDFPDLDTILAPALLEDFGDSTDVSRWIGTGSENRYAFLLRKIREVKSLSLRELGTLVIILDKSQLVKKSVFHPFQADLGLAILSQDTLLYSSGGAASELFAQAKIGEKPYEVRALGGERYFLAQISPTARGIRYAYVLPYRRLFSDFRRFRQTLTTFAVALVAAIAALSIWVADTVSRPIIRLADTMRTTQAERLSRIQIEGRSRRRHDEIGVLYREFTVMLERIGRLIRERYKTQLLLKDTELRSLQAQINPHFLYNTLESINWLAQLRDDEQIAAMAQALGRIMRASIDSKTILIKLRDELELLRQYVLIQRMRYGERLAVDFRVQQECLDVAVPKLTLQPLVENSIRYGLERSARQCHIRVSAARSGQAVCIRVQDNGPGLGKDQATRLLRGRGSSASSGVGIRNIRGRLKSLYGVRASVALESGPRKGTIVTLKIPRSVRQESRVGGEKLNEKEDRTAG